jgi:hypothetical protein
MKQALGNCFESVCRPPRPQRTASAAPGGGMFEKENYEFNSLKP